MGTYITLMVCFGFIIYSLYSLPSFCNYHISSATKKNKSHGLDLALSEGVTFFSYFVFKKLLGKDS